MVINYIILAHQNPAQLERLVDRLYDKDTYFFIHIDRQVDITEFEKNLKDKKQVYFLPNEKRIQSLWGSCRVIDATLALVEQVIQYNSEGYTVLLSGQDYPLKSNTEIRRFFEKSNECNYIEGFKLPNALWPDEETRLKYYSFFSANKKRKVLTVPPISLFIQKKDFSICMMKKYARLLTDYPGKSWLVARKREWPKQLKPFGGMAYWALPLSSLKVIMKYIEDNPDYLSYHEHTLYPDEVFFQTLVYNLFTNNKPKLTFAYWPSISDCSPKTFTYDDLDLLSERSELYARKFDTETDFQILDAIDQNFLHDPIFKEIRLQS